MFKVKHAYILLNNVWKLERTKAFSQKMLRCNHWFRNEIPHTGKGQRELLPRLSIIVASGLC